MADKLISVINMKKHFTVRTSGFKSTVIKAVDGVSFDINEGEVFGIVGESGSGKSTIANCLLKLYDPTEGELVFCGRYITKLEPIEVKYLRNNISLVFQDPFSSLNPRKKIGWLLEETLIINTKMTKYERYNEVGLMLQAVGLKSFHRDRYPRELSGGQRQRVAFALALILGPKLIVADEPLSSLDVSIRNQILELMQELKRERGLSYLFISHDLNTVRHVCDKIAVMHKGCFVEMGPTKDIFEKRLHPYTKLLFDATPSLVQKLEPRLVEPFTGHISGTLTEVNLGHFVDLG